MTAEILKTVLVFLAVIGGLGAITLITKRRGFALPLPVRKDARRLHVMETMPLGPRRTLVIFKCDSTEYLICLGPDRDLLVGTDIACCTAGEKNAYAPLSSVKTADSAGT